MKNAIVLALLSSVTGCYTYVPVERTVPERGQEIRVGLPQPQAIALGPVTVHEVNRVEGTVYRTTTDTLAISSQWFHTRLRQRYFANGHIHVLLHDQAANLEVRRLHIGKTILATGGVLAAATAVFAFTTDLGGGGINDPGRDGTEASIIGTIPIFSIPIP